MERLVCYILKSLLKDDLSNNIKIVLNENEEHISFNVSIPRNIKNSVIGKNGKVINSVREYLRTISKKFGNKRIYIRINEI
ncbi:MAG: KH domain-containing protein [Elusimicrobiales bacterium]|nr:KH domain-containing protein [Elusimicrobiales bacterium]